MACQRPMQARNPDAETVAAFSRLGSGFDVHNFGIAGRTMVPSDRWYRDSEEFEDSVDAEADIYLIKLGTPFPCTPSLHRMRRSCRDERRQGRQLGRRRRG